MRRHVLGWITMGALLFQSGLAVAQDSFQTLEQELNEAKQQHQEVTTQALSNFFDQVDAAMASPDAAVALYQKAGGVMPTPSPVVTQHENETVTEKETRLAQDQANLARLGAVLQLHCGLLHYAALFVAKPQQPGLQDEWVAWLKSTAQVYPQLALPSDNGDQPPDPQNRKKNAENGAPATPRPSPFDVTELKGKTMRDSIISKFLGFKSWSEKPQAGWSVRDLPGLYRTNLLDPLRASPTSGTLAAWDVYIGMLSADETDNDKWNQVVYPPLHFERACDDYTVTPSTEKLEALVNLIKANPTYPQVDDWISRVHQLMDGYRASHGGAPAAVQNPTTVPSGNPNVTVTSVQQGDMTIITTHTNSAPVTNAPPAH